MDAQRWRKIEALYHAAREREPEERPAYLAEACGEDEELRREVESLLAQDVSGSGLLDHPAWEGEARLRDAAPKPATDEAPRGGRHPFVWVVRLTAPVVVAAFAYAAWLLLTGGTLKSFGWREVSRDGVWYLNYAQARPAESA